MCGHRPHQKRKAKKKAKFSALMGQISLQFDDSCGLCNLLHNQKLSAHAYARKLKATKAKEKMKTLTTVTCPINWKCKKR